MCVSVNKLPAVMTWKWNGWKLSVQPHDCKFIALQNCKTWLAEVSDVVLETKVLVSRHLEDKNESLGLGS